MRLIPTTLAALAATALLASCGANPQARLDAGARGGAGDAGATAEDRKAARYNVLRVIPECSCNAARGLATSGERGDRFRAISFAVTDEGATDDAQVQVFLGTSTYEILEPNDVAVVISGADVTITAASIPLIAGTGTDPIINVVITFNTSTGAWSLTVDGASEGSGTAEPGFREAIPGSCDLPTPYSFPDT